MSQLMMMGAGRHSVAAAVENLAQGSNTFNGSRVWAENGASGGSMALTSGPEITNSVTGETYWDWQSGGGAQYRFDTIDVDNTLTPAGNTQYTLSLYVKKGSNQTFSMDMRTLGGTDATSSVDLNTSTWVGGGGTLAAAHDNGVDDEIGFDDLGGNEGRLRITITTPASTTRLLITMYQSAASQSIYVSSSMINLGTT